MVASHLWLTRFSFDLLAQYEYGQVLHSISLNESHGSALSVILLRNLLESGILATLAGSLGVFTYNP